MTYAEDFRARLDAMINDLGNEWTADAVAPLQAENTDLHQQVATLEARVAELEAQLESQTPPTIFALDASPAPGTDWAGDALAKQALFASAPAPAPAFNIARGIFFPPSSTANWSSSMFTNQRKGDVLHVSKKGSVTPAEMTALFNDPKLDQFPLFLFTFNHEIKAADMSVSTWVGHWTTVHNAYLASPFRHKIRLVVNVNHYQAEHGGFNWESYLKPIAHMVHYYSEDIYNEAWLSSSGYETAANVLGGFLARAKHVQDTYGLRSAVVEFGADQTTADTTGSGLLKVYTDTCKLLQEADIAWVGFWADNAKTPVWHKDASHPVFKYVKSQLEATRGLAAQL